ncbi:peptidase [Mycolicibacterium celeriflavum]|uniref:neutral zinc metallopeptidase n=1 Tax=Mycolicibacterium celeriflavum TaxID=1249101 RepID=UPI0007FBA89A|nr:neutral zinc metallopeptidase [Mycolicibacterium celeriflavum]OBG12553.1 peptidase [Mycolicibacterium celeriflavum]
MGLIGQVSRRRGRWLRPALASAAVSAVVLTGCSTVEGQAVSSLYNPNTVGGLTVADGPSGLRPDAAEPTGEVRYTDDGPVDRMALSAVNDLVQFWEEHYSEALDGTFDPVANLASYDSEDPLGPPLCGQILYEEPNAFFCPRSELIAWDRGVLVPTGQKFFGDMSVAALIAHEYGHAVQNMAGLVDRSTPTIVREQQADCFAGSYTRWVAEGSSPRFEMSTGDGLNKVLAGVITIRDPILTPEDAEMVEGGHGTALDRVSAFQSGFTDGVSTCAAIDLDSIEQSRADLPIVLDVDDSGALQTGETALDEALVTTVVEALNMQFEPAQPPTLSMQPGQSCADAKVTEPTSYCPENNTISVDLPGMQALGTQAGTEEGVLVQGDNTAISVLTSRYVLALQHQRQAQLDSAATALRTACLTGVAQRGMVEEVKLPSGNSIVLTAGDLDEAVAGLLNNGLASSDVNGNTVAAGFTRIMAFRSGLVNPDADACFTRFPE